MENIETRLSIVLRLPEDISNKILDFKKRIGVYYPDYEDSYPHITLYSCKFEEKKYPELIKSLSGLSHPPLKFTLSDLIFSEQPKRKQTFVHFSVNEKSQLQDLHEKVVSIANPLRGDLVRYKDVQRYEKGILTEEEFVFTKKYGFLYFMERYNPHITVAAIDIGDSLKENLLKEGLGDLAGKSFIADRMFVKIKKRTIPEEEVIYESEITEIPLR